MRTIEYQVENTPQGRHFTTACPNCGQVNGFYCGGYYKEHPVICKWCDFKYVVQEIKEGKLNENI